MHGARLAAAKDKSGRDMSVNSDIAKLVDPNRPLLLLDADEVLLKFVEHLEVYLTSQGAELRLNSFQLGGNIFYSGTEDVAPPDAVRAFIAGFFDDCVDDLALVDGAKPALDALSETYQIMILSNVPSRCRARREANLRDHGLAYPVIANKGEKGPMARDLAAATSLNAVFVDDLPPQHSSVATAAPAIHRVHFVGDPRLARLISKAPDAHTRIDCWHALLQYLERLDGGHNR